METVQIKHIPILEVGEAHQCHYNSAMYAIENDCNFVCGFLDNLLSIPHCIAEKDGIYIDPTLNREQKFRVVATYTPAEINEIFSKVGMAFIPFMGDELGYNAYDGMKRVPNEELESWHNYINELRFDEDN